jgi:hypothetical protein
MLQERNPRISNTIKLTVEQASLPCHEGSDCANLFLVIYLGSWSFILRIVSHQSIESFMRIYIAPRELVNPEN